MSLYELILMSTGKASSRKNPLYGTLVPWYGFTEL